MLFFAYLASWRFVLVERIDVTEAFRSPHSIRTVALIGAAALIGPLIGFSLSALGLVLAPTWTFLSGLIYPVLPGLGVLLGIVAFAKGWIDVRGLIVALVLTVAVGCLYLALLNPARIPTGMTACQPLDAEPPQVRYHCVSTSSDDLDYHREFIIAGRAGWPVMRIIESKP